MLNKRVIFIITACTLSFTILFGSMTFAGTVSEEKVKVMIAAGEIPSVEQPSEENVKVKKDAAIGIAKKMLEDASSYEVGGVTLHPRWGTRGSTWNIDFYKKQPPGGNANINIDANSGEIIGFNFWDYMEGQPNYVAKITRAEARVKAEEFLKSKLKEELDNFELQKEDPYANAYRMGGVREQVMYNFNYLKKINGIPFTNDSVYIGVDGTNGKVRSFNCNFFDVDRSKFPSSDGVISKENVLKKYREALHLSLQYITGYDNRSFGPSKPKAMLAYVPFTNTNMMDAKTGEAVNYDGSSINVDNEAFKKLAEKPVPMDPDARLESTAVSEAQAKTIAEGLKKAVEQMAGISFDANKSGDEYYKPRYFGPQQEEMWNYNWNTVNTDNEEIRLDVAINAKTGHIGNMNFNRYSYMDKLQYASGKQPPEVKEAVNWQQGKEKALEAVKKLLPGQYGFFVDQNIQEPQYNAEAKKFMKEYNYSFSRVVNGVLYRDNNINVAIDRETGKMRYIYFNWSEMDFPSNTAAVTREQAADQLFEGTEAKLVYLLQNFHVPMGEPKFAGAPKLVYVFNGKGYMYGNFMIDASTGKFIDWSGREIKVPASTSGESSLPEHWAKRSVELLIAQGILKDPYVNYDTALTRMDAVKMMSLAKGMMFYEPGAVNTQSFTDVSKDDENYMLVENAVKQRILETTGGQLKGSEAITKEEFVKLLVNLIGYGDIAKHKDIYKMEGVKNVSDDRIGYVAICSALNILPVKDGEVFDGKAGINFAEAAAALYRALSLIK